MKLLKDYKMVLNFKLGKGKKEIEDINEVLLSSTYYPNYGEYGVDNFLSFYAETVKKILLAKQLEKDLTINKTITPRRKIWTNNNH